MVSQGQEPQLGLPAAAFDDMFFWWLCVSFWGPQPVAYASSGANVQRGSGPVAVVLCVKV